MCYLGSRLCRYKVESRVVFDRVVSRALRGVSVERWRYRVGSMLLLGKC